MSQNQDNMATLNSMVAGGRLRMAALVWSVCLMGAVGAGPETPLRPYQNDGLTPRPQQMRQRDGAVGLDSTWRIVTLPENAGMRFAAAWLRKGLGLDLTNAPAQDETTGRRIILLCDDGSAAARRIMDRHSLAFPKPAKFQKEGYLLEVYPGAQPEIIIAAPTAAGVFYGANTLMQLASPDKKLDAVSIMDYPDLEWRGIESISYLMPGTNGNLEFTQVKKDAIDRLARMKINMLWCSEYGGGGYNHFLHPEAYWHAYFELFQYARERHIEIVPLVGSLRNLWDVPRDLAEGYWVRDEPFTFGTNDTAQPDMDAVNLVTNGDFEMVSSSGQPVAGWTAYHAANVALTTNTASHGRQSVCLHLERAINQTDAQMYDGRPVLEYVVNLQPNSFYLLMADFKAAMDVPDIATFAANVMLDGKVVSDRSTTFGNSTEWRPRFIGVATTGAGNQQLKIWIYIWRGSAGNFWVDNVQCYRMNGKLLNVIRNADTDITVSSPDGKRQYVKGRDYEVIDGDFPARNKPIYWGTGWEPKPFGVRRLSSGAIPPGGRVAISYDSLLPTEVNNAMNLPECVSDERLYTEYVYPAIDRITTNFQPRCVFIGCDEVRGFNRDSRNRRRGLTNAELYAEYISKVNTRVRQKSPASRISMWGDMLSLRGAGSGNNPYYQLAHGSDSVGRMAEAIEKGMIDKSVLLSAWALEDCILFAQKGYQYLGCFGCSSGFGSETDAAKATITTFAQMLVDSPGGLGCLAYQVNTPWVYGACADRFWNARGKIVWMDSFETVQVGLQCPEGWTPAGQYLYSTNGAQAYLMQCAVMLSGTNALASTLLPVKSGKSYELVAHIKREKAGQTGAPAICFDWYDAARQPVGESRLAPEQALGAEYASCRFAAAVPGNASFISIRLEGAGNKPAGFWFDLLYLIEKY